MNSKSVHDKKHQFSKPQKSKLPFIIGIIAVVLAAGYVVNSYRTQPQSPSAAAGFGAPVAEARSYVGERIYMTNVEPIVEDGKIKLPLSDVDANSIVYFELENNEGTLVPMMAYITPSGRLFAGSSMCEPCKGRKFSLAGETLVCDTCGTTYTIESHEFISGAQICGQYPPANMNPVVEDGMIIIDLDDVLNWRSRA